jgi:carbon-monoxide dehydrogenase large subunit
VTTAAAGRELGAPLLSPEVPGNLCFEWHAGDGAAVDRAFAAAAHVVSLNVTNHRIVTNRWSRGVWSVSMIR